MTQNKPQVSIHIVSWNSLNHLPSCLAALGEQTYPAIRIMIVDNASQDGTTKWLEEHYPQLHVLRNTRNVGFCRAQNQALLLTDSPYVLVLNPDVILEPDWISRAVDMMEQQPALGSFGGKIRRYSYTPDELKEVVKSGILDSAGLVGNRQRHFIDRGSGQPDQGQYDLEGLVFGHSGASIFYRRAALETIRYRDEYFDDDFFAYKDDIDAAWRLQLMGWDSWYEPQAVAYHHRTARGTSKTSALALAKNHRRHNQLVTLFSYRNHLLLLTKLERRQTVWRDWPWIGWYEIKKFGYYLITQPRTLRGVGQVFKLWSRMRKKSSMIQHQSKRTALEVRQWFLTSPSA